MAAAGTFAILSVVRVVRARYIKEVDATEHTVRFAQEIYDDAGRLIAVHEKFPGDLGHQQM